MAGQFAFDSVHHFGAASIGEPGNRFFFLIIGGDDGWVRVWMEKEQLRALADGFGELLTRVAGEPTLSPQSPVPAEPPSAPLLGEFLVARLAVGYDADRDAIVLLAHANDSENDDEPTLACRATKEQAALLTSQAIAVCDAGRPVCTMCQEPIDPSGHLCPKSNGHRRTGL